MSSDPGLVELIKIECVDVPAFAGVGVVVGSFTTGCLWLVVPRVVIVP